MIVIVDYGMGNLASIANMLRKVGASAIVSSDPKVIADATKLVLPGVGAFDNGMRNMTDMGLIPLLETKVIGEKTPVLGICLGMQLMTAGSEEGSMHGLGWIDGKTVRFNFSRDSGLRVPHMGWNSVRCVRPSSILNDSSEYRFYFVHSYHVVCANSADELARTQYGYEFTSAIERGNICGVQFHPEKSHKYGMRLMRSFAEGG